MLCVSCSTNETEATTDPGNESDDTASDTFASGDDAGDTDDAGAGESDTENGSLDSWVNVIAVAASGSDGAYAFSVTIESADIDCTRYADWWEVISEDGTLLYRRILAHPHTEELSGNPVTRSGSPVPVSAQDNVIVRAHMNDAGYSGTPMRGTVEDGFVSFPEITSDFASEVESEEPQPDECIPEEDVV